MPDSRNSHRSFTVRVPMAMYAEIADKAKFNKTNMNGQVNELLTLGLGREVRVNEALGKLIKRIAQTDETFND